MKSGQGAKALRPWGLLIQVDFDFDRSTLELATNQGYRIARKFSPAVVCGLSKERDIEQTLPAHKHNLSSPHLVSFTIHVIMLGVPSS